MKKSLFLQVCRTPSHSSVSLTLFHPSFLTRFNYLGKSSWPELVFIESSIAVHLIKKDNPDVKTIVLLAGTGGTKDFRHDRVRVFVNINDKVVEVPQVG